MIIEIAGEPGAGKSAVARGVANELRAMGRTALSAEDAVLLCLRRSRAGRIGLALLGPAGHGRMRRLMVDVPGTVVTIGRQPLLSARVVRSVAASRLPFAHRQLLLSRFFVAAARDRFLRRHLADEETAIVDEGLVHRVVNTFGWREAEPSRQEVTAYLRGITPPDVVVFVTASAEVRDHRLRERGLPVRLRGRPADEVRAFLVRAGRLLAIASSAMGERSRVATVGNDGLLDDTSRSIAAMLGGPDDTVPGNDRTRWPWDLPRPDRSVARWRAARSAVSDPAAATGVQSVDAVLATLGRVRRGPARVLAAGRSTTFLVGTDQGPVIVKRYKRTVDDAAIANEHAVLLEMQRLGVPAPRLVVGPGRISSVRTADGRYAAFDYLPGRHPAHDRFVPGRRRVAAIGGSVLGNLHLTLAGFRPPADAPAGLDLAGRRVRDHEWHGARASEALDRALEGDEELRRRADATVRRIRELEVRLMAAQLPIATIHGDFGPYNLLVRHGKPATPIDFELARLDWRVVDVVTAWPRFAVGRLGLNRRAADSFLRSYRDACGMTTAEVEAMPAVAEYLALRRAVVLWHRATTSRGVAEATAWLVRAAAPDPGRRW